MTVPFVMPADQTFIIAEAGVNHNGDMALAEELVLTAVDAGADAVKFQLFDPAMLTTALAPMASYQKDQVVDVRSQQDLLAALTLPLEGYQALQALCQKQGIQFLCTPFEAQSARYLVETLQVNCLKLPSGEITNLPFLELIASFQTPVILSTGMSTLAEVQMAVDTIRQINHLPLGILHCVSSYPAPADAMNLRAISTLQQAFPDAIIGFSDHSLGIHLSVAAVAMGARIVEKHFTLDKSMPGPDHKASLSVEDLKAMVSAIRDVEKALGDGVKQPQPCETDCMQVARKSLVTAHDLPADHLLTMSDLVCKRPGTGISPAHIHEVIGYRIQTSLPADVLLAWEHLEMPAAFEKPRSEPSDNHANVF